MPNTDTEMEVPEYLVLPMEGRGAFFAPNYVEPGSGVRTWLSPGPHLQPVNDAARARMEAWYDEEFPAYDEKRKPLFSDGKRVMLTPHAMYRPPEVGARSAVPTVEVIAPPNRASVPTMSLAEIIAGTDKKGTDQRPPADHRMHQPNTSPVITKGNPAEEDEILPTAQVVSSPTPKPNAPTRTVAQ